MANKNIDQVNSRTSGSQPSQTPRNQERQRGSGNAGRGTDTKIKFSTKK